MRKALSVLAALLIGTGQVSLAQESEPSDLVGTWVLVSLERGVSRPEPARSRGARGLLVIDRAGDVYEYFSGPDNGGQDARGTAAQQTLANVGGFWGHYDLDAKSGEIDFQAEDGVSPAVRGLHFSRSYQLHGDRLVLTSTDEPQAQGDTRWTWMRMPIVENFSPAYAQVVGFWQHVEERRVNTATGEVERTSHRAPSVIVYTPSGFVGVHFPTLGRESFAGDEPTEEEAQAAVRGYLGYFGALSVFPGEVSHDILSGISPTTGSILRRYAKITGDTLVVTLQGFAGPDADGPPPVVTEVELHRLSGADDMLPRSN